MNTKPRVLFVRSFDPYNTGYYYKRAFQRLDINLIDQIFTPYQVPPRLAHIKADLLVLCDSGTLAHFHDLNDFQGLKGFISIDSSHKFEIHQNYVNQYNFDIVWVAQKHV